MADDQAWPLYVDDLPAATATQEVVLEHDTESIEPPSATDRGAAHTPRWSYITCPSPFTATQNVGDGHETE
jgi:hypothetical protein